MCQCQKSLMPGVNITKEKKDTWLSYLKIPVWIWITMTLEDYLWCWFKLSVNRSETNYSTLNWFLLLYSAMSEAQCDTCNSSENTNPETGPKWSMLPWFKIRLYLFFWGCSEPGCRKDLNLQTDKNCRCNNTNKRGGEKSLIQWKAVALSIYNARCNEYTRR